jgi:hypothetical protein
MIFGSGSNSNKRGIAPTAADSVRCCDLAFEAVRALSHNARFKGFSQEEVNFWLAVLQFLRESVPAHPPSF